MREISFETVDETVASLFMEANYVIGPDITCSLRAARQRSAHPAGLPLPALFPRGPAAATVIIELRVESLE